ncbi:unnamed protein product [Boreogadus saida]
MKLTVCVCACAVCLPVTYALPENQAFQPMTERSLHAPAHGHRAHAKPKRRPPRQRCERQVRLTKTHRSQVLNGPRAVGQQLTDRNRPAL